MITMVPQHHDQRRWFEVSNGGWALLPPQHVARLAHGLTYTGVRKSVGRGAGYSARTDSPLRRARVPWFLRQPHPRRYARPPKSKSK